jgi:hypothetical protein
MCSTFLGCCRLTLRPDTATCKLLKGVGTAMGYMILVVGGYFALMGIGWAEYKLGLFTWENGGTPCAHLSSLGVPFWLGCPFQGFYTTAAFLVVGALVVVLCWLGLSTIQDTFSKPCAEWKINWEQSRRMEYQEIPGSINNV